jgi:hypothetical protein
MHNGSLVTWTAVSLTTADLRLDLVFLLYNVGTDRQKTPFISESTENFVNHPYPVSTEKFPRNGLVLKNPSQRKRVCRLLP